MKEYRKTMRIINGLLTVIYVMGFIANTFEKSSSGFTKLCFTLCLIILPIIEFSPLKYFCGVVSLRVSDEKVVRVWMSFKTCTITRENNVVSCRRIAGLNFMIFSNSDLSHARTAKVLGAALRRKAIIFPYTSQIWLDFPQWFE